MDLASFERFYHTHYSKLLSMASQVLCDDVAARDVVADAFECFFRLNGQPASANDKGMLIMVRNGESSRVFKM